MWSQPDLSRLGILGGMCKALGSTLLLKRQAPCVQHCLPHTVSQPHTQLLTLVFATYMPVELSLCFICCAL